MDCIKQKFIELGLPKADDVKKLIKEHGDVVLGSYTIDQVLSGQKGMVALLTDTSKLDPEKGISFRGYSIDDLYKILPRSADGGEPLPEGLFYLMLMGEIPTVGQVECIRRELASRTKLPEHVYEVMDVMANKSRPMTQLATAILAMATESKFQKAYRAGISKKDHWDTTYEDVMDLIARLPIVAAYIYRKNYCDGDIIPPNPELDWSANFAHMMGFDGAEVADLFRLYLTIHADHEGGNVSAHTAHLVGSALSNPYYAYAAAMTGLAGPLHGYANQEVIMWIFDMLKELGTDSPSKDQIVGFVKKTLEHGQVVPGYGHAVLRKTDPRFTVQQHFAEKHFPDDRLYNVVKDLYATIPPILESLGKVKNPWPNVDAISGAMLYHYGLKEFNFYTCMFGVSRVLGVTASLIWDRVYGLPLERPSSNPIEWFKAKAGI